MNERDQVTNEEIIKQTINIFAKFVFEILNQYYKKNKNAGWVFRVLYSLQLLNHKFYSELIMSILPIGDNKYIDQNKDLFLRLLFPKVDKVEEFKKFPPSLFDFLKFTQRVLNTKDIWFDNKINSNEVGLRKDIKFILSLQPFYKLFLDYQNGSLSIHSRFLERFIKLSNNAICYFFEKTFCNEHLPTTNHYEILKKHSVITLFLVYKLLFDLQKNKDSQFNQKQAFSSVLQIVKVLFKIFLQYQFKNESKPLNDENDNSDNSKIIESSPRESTTPQLSFYPLLNNGFGVFSHPTEAFRCDRAVRSLTVVPR